MSSKFRFPIAAPLLASSFFADAAESTHPTYLPPPAISSSNIVQIIFSLLLVLAAIVLVAWLLKRVNASRFGTGNLLKVLGSIAIGQRERVVLLELNDTWLVIGVGPGQIRTLHTLPKQEIQSFDNSHSSTVNNRFSNLLTSFIRQKSSDGKRNAP